MNNLLRGGLAGAAAYKLGGGLISTILIFIVIFWLWENANRHGGSTGPLFSFLHPVVLDRILQPAATFRPPYIKISRLSFPY